MVRKTKTPKQQLKDAIFYLGYRDKLRSLK
jgi:hypothetical protein